MEFVRQLLLKHYIVPNSTIHQVLNEDNPILSEKEDELFMTKFFDQEDFVSDNGEESESEFDGWKFDGRKI